MDAIPQKVLNWLHSVLLGVEYGDVSRAYADIGQTLAQYNTLRPSTDVYTFENGRSSLLLHISGTIPVTFRGATYSIPVSLWVPQAYPQEVPIAFVTPTPSMAVRPGQHVDVEGKLYHPYLANWRPDRSTVSEFVRVLQDVFSREPPVVAKQAAPPLPPLPSELSRTQDQPPPPPPKPFKSQSRSQALKTGEGPPVASRPPVSPGESRSANSNAYSTQPRNQSAALPNAHPMQRPGSVQAAWYQTGREQSTSLAQPQGPHQPFPQTRENGRTAGPYPAHHHPTITSDRNRQGYGLQPYHQQGGQPLQADSYQSHRLPQSKAPAPQPPIDLLTSSFDPLLPTQPPSNSVPAPPIPPNPEKDALLSAISRSLTTVLHNTIASNAAAVPPLQAQHTALQSTFHKMQQEHAALTSLQSLLDSDESILRTAMRESDACIADAQHRPVPGVDEVLMAPTVVGQQMYDLVAEGRACAEAREVLAKALDRGRVGVEVWAKAVRGLAREEFMKKALLRRCAEGMGLDGLERREGGAAETRPSEHGEADDDDYYYHR